MYSLYYINYALRYAFSFRLPDAIDIRLSQTFDDTLVAPISPAISVIIALSSAEADSTAARTRIVQVAVAITWVAATASSKVSAAASCAAITSRDTQIAH